MCGLLRARFLQAPSASSQAPRILWIHQPLAQPSVLPALPAQPSAINSHWSRWAGFVRPAINIAGPICPTHSQANARTLEVAPDGAPPRTAPPGFIFQFSSPEACLTPPTVGPTVSIAGPVGSAVSYQHRQTCWLDVFPQLRLIHNSAIRILILLLSELKR